MTKDIRVAKQVQVTCIEKPYIYWRGKWRTGIIAFLHGGNAHVQVTTNTCVVMEPSKVMKDGSEVGKRNKKYATGWIVDNSNRRNTTVTHVELIFGRRWGQDSVFFFQRITPKSKKPLVEPRFRRDHQWDFDRSINSKHTPRFFHKETAALRFAVRLAKQNLKDPAKQIREQGKNIEALARRLAKAKT